MKQSTLIAAIVGFLAGVMLMALVIPGSGGDPDDGVISPLALPETGTRKEAPRPIEHPPKPSDSSSDWRERCRIKTGMMTALLPKPDIFAQKIMHLPDHEYYKVLDRQIVKHAGSAVFFFKITEEKANLTGWVKAGIGLDVVDPVCYEIK